MQLKYKYDSLKIHLKQWHQIITMNGLKLILRNLRHGVIAAGKNARVPNRLHYCFVNFPLSSKYYHEQLPTTIDKALHLARKQDKLNEKCYLIEHAAELIDKDPKLYSARTKRIIIEELTLWKNTSGRFQRVATVAWVIRKLNLRDRLKELYEDIVHRIKEDQWYVNFDESVKAIQAFSDYPDEQVRNQIYEKIERNLGLTISDVNMNYYQRICLSLLEAGRARSSLWNKLEQLVLRNLGMQYSAKTFFDIFKAFAISQNGTDNFYAICQQIIFRGHLYNRSYFLKSNLPDFDSTGQYFALLVETYATVNKFTPINLDADFLDYLYKSMLNSRIEYNQVSSLTKILRSLPDIQFHDDEVEDVVHSIIERKRFTRYSSIEQIRDLYAELERRYGAVPMKIAMNVEELVVHDINRKLLPMATAVSITQYLLSHRPQSMGSKDLIASLEYYLQNSFKYLPPQQIRAVQQVWQTSSRVSQQIEHKQAMLPQLKSHEQQKQVK